jgi:hypothetical protein
VWSFVGLLVSIVVAACAWARSRGSGGFYDSQVYGMTARTHRVYAIASLAFAVFFSFTLTSRRDLAGVVALALYAVIAIFYGTSFLRGASDDDE